MKPCDSRAILLELAPHPSEVWVEWCVEGLHPRWARHPAVLCSGHLFGCSQRFQPITSVRLALCVVVATFFAAERSFPSCGVWAGCLDSASPAARVAGTRIGALRGRVCGENSGDAGQVGRLELGERLVVCLRCFLTIWMMKGYAGGLILSMDRLLCISAR